MKDTSTLQPLATTSSPSAPDASGEGLEVNDESASKSSTTCLLCGASFQSFDEQRLHGKSDWHHYNLKQKVGGERPATENEFEKLVDELDESISGSGSDTSESEDQGDRAKNNTLTALLKKQAKLSNGNPGETEEFLGKRKKRGSGKPPLVWFNTPLLPSNTSLGIYRALFTNIEQEEQDMVDVIKKKQLRPVPLKPPVTDASNGVPLPSTMTSPSVFMCMIGGGHFAGMVVSLAPKVGKQSSGTEQRQAIVIAHKTFHRYTTRRKQGGAQSANDSAKGAAHSAGSSLRRYNEVALEQEIRALLVEWKDLIVNAQLIFIRATGSSNRRILFGPYENQVLRQNDPRNRTFPFSTRRATQAELMRAFVELTGAKTSQIDEAALLAASTPSTNPQPKLTPLKPTAPPISKEEEAAVLHTSQLQALIRRSKAPSLLTYLQSNSLSPSYPFHPPASHSNHHAPTPLHLAASLNHPAIILALLTKARADPTPRNAEGKTAFDLSGDRATRDAFRVARSELGEATWDWSAANIPPALTKREAEERDSWERAEEAKTEAERRRGEEERLKREGPKVEEKATKGGNVLGGKKTAEEKREEEGRGMSDAMKARMERERRARAAEARFARGGAGLGSGGGR